MNKLESLIDRLKKVGIQPQVTIVVDANTSDVQAIKTLQTSLKNAGIMADVHINLPASSTTPGLSPPDAPMQIGQEHISVRVKEPRLNCFTFRKIDKAGKPEMVIREPRIQLQQGASFFVSSSHKVSQNDPGNGIIFGTGNIEFYFVADCPSNPAAVGLFVRKIDVETNT